VLCKVVDWTHIGLFDPSNEGTTILENISKYLPMDIV
jgi:hypothetical protein